MSERKTCWCDDKEVYALTHPEESQYSAPRDLLCKDCCMVRCDAYPGVCRGENYYDRGGTMRNKRVREIAEAEGVSCTDCIHEALMTIGHWDFDLDYRVPTDLRQKFIETLHHYDMTEH